MVPPPSHDTSSRATLLVVGDVHKQWRREDREFLERGAQDTVLFVGDLGDEDVEIVREVAAVRAPKAVILGNHDAWQSFSRRKPTRALLESLDVLAGDHLAYEVRELPRARVSILGARPFSWGGKSLRSPEIYRRLYDVEDVETSAERIVEAARRAHHRDLVILAHNGPSGLSRRPTDIWGKDFGRGTGDWGDKDLELAIERIRDLGLRVRCVIAGHMHERLVRPRGARRRRLVAENGTTYVNTAVVPRIRELDGGLEVAHYVRVRLHDGVVESVEDLWIDRTGRVVPGSSGQLSLQAPHV